MEKLSFKAGEVEGPLDLILTLISRHKLNIYDIEISTLVEQYTAAVREMEQADLEVGSEFIEMAARLVYIKTVELLPRHEKPEEDPRQELTGQLLEYQACRRAAALLRERCHLDEQFVREPAALAADTTYRLRHPPLLLAESYRRAHRPGDPGGPAACRGVPPAGGGPGSSRWGPGLCPFWRGSTGAGRWPSPGCLPTAGSAARWWPPFWRCSS